MRRLLGIFGLALLAGCQSGTLDAKQACEKTVRDYAIYRDEGPVEAYADLFTEDGTFELGGTKTEGRDALIARHKSATEAAAWRHTITDVRISKTDTGLKGVSRFIVMTGPHLDTPSAEATREILGDYLDEFVVKNGQCKIKSRKVNIAFDTLFVKPRR